MMRCHEIEQLLAAARSPKELPEEARLHVESCAGCSAVMSALIRLDSAVRTGMIHAEFAEADRLRELQNRLDSPISRQDRAGTGFFRWVFVIAATIAIFCVGWIGGSMNSQGGKGAPNREVGSPISAVARVLPETDLNASPYSEFAELVAAIPEYRTKSERRRAFRGLGNHLRSQVVRTSHQHRVAELASLVTAHERVVRTSAAWAVADSMADRNKEEAAALVKVWQGWADEARTAAGQTPPVIAELLIHLESTLHGAIDRVKSGMAAEPIPVIESGDPLEMLVMLGSRAADLDSNLARADVSSSMAAILAEMLVAVSFDGNDTDADRISKTLGRLLDRGVGENLESAAREDLLGKSATEVSRIRQQAFGLTAMLEHNMRHAPPHACHRLQPAVERSRSWHDQRFGKGNAPLSKSPPSWGKSGDRGGPSGGPGPNIPHGTMGPEWWNRGCFNGWPRRN